MPNFAILDGNNKVINVIVADSIEILSSYNNVVEDNKQTPAMIGQVYDSILDYFVEFVAIEEPAEVVE
jgi:hypothetical protein